MVSCEEKIKTPHDYIQSYENSKQSRISSC